MASDWIRRPALQVLKGLEPGRVYPLDRATMVVGQDPTCDIVLASRTVSHAHARITIDRSGCWIKDLRSRNKTRIDGEAIAEATRLKDGARIRLGDQLLLFTCPPVTERARDVKDEEILSQVEIHDSSSWMPSGVSPQDQLRAVLQIGSDLAGSLDLAEVLERVLKTLFEIFPKAERGFVMLGDEAGDLPSLVMKARQGEPSNVTISRTIFHYVVDGGRAILSEDASIDDRFGESQDSIVASETRSMMCVPLRDRERGPIGILQIDTRNPRRKFERADLDLLIAVSAQVGVAVENASLHKQAIRQRELEQDARHARAVQMALLPRRRPHVPGYDFWHEYEPALYVGGDYFDYYPISRPDDPPGSPPSLWAITVGDVAGHGMAAALVMARLSCQLRPLLRVQTDPASLVQLLNSELCEAGTGDRFISFVLVLLDARTHEITVVNAGHPAPLVRRADGRIETIGAEESGLVLGVSPDQSYRAVRSSIEPGEVILLYTDGASDVENSRHQTFTVPRLVQTFASAPAAVGEAGEAVIRAVRDHVGGWPHLDDITLVCFGRDREASSPPAGLTSGSAPAPGS